MAGLCVATHGFSSFAVAFNQCHTPFSPQSMGLVRFGTTKAVDAKLAARIE